MFQRESSREISSLRSCDDVYPCGVIRQVLTLLASGLQKEKPFPLSRCVPFMLDERLTCVKRWGSLGLESLVGTSDQPSLPGSGGNPQPGRVAPKGSCRTPGR